MLPMSPMRHLLSALQIKVRLSLLNGASRDRLPKLLRVLCNKHCCRHLSVCTLTRTTGQTQHTVLSNILGLLLELIPSNHQAWSAMPSTLAGFQSHVLNPTNQHALVSILPVPMSYMLHDGCHAYCCIQEIAAFVLLLPRTK